MIIAVLAGFGIIFGSFINALVWRIHEQEEGQARNRDLSILHGRSMCPHCSHTLAARDLIPVLSWLSLRGRCRYCHKPISWQYPLVELATGALFALTYALWPVPVAGIGLTQFGLILLALIIFVALTVYDIHWFTLPDRLVFPLIGVAIAYVAATALYYGEAHFWLQPFIGMALIFGLFWGLLQVSDGAWIGGGDVKLALALGLLAGSPLRAILVIFIASLLGTVVGLPQVFARGKGGLKAHIPFGPFLLAATYIVLLFGGQLIRWYGGLFY